MGLCISRSYSNKRLPGWVGLCLWFLLPGEVMAGSGAMQEEFRWPGESHACVHAWDERLMRQGPAADWQLRRQHKCGYRDLWWVLELKPRVRRSWYGGLADANGNVVFEFEPDFSTRLEHFVNERYTGPPKWMPPEQAYWDASIGDWRYLERNPGHNIFAELSEPELLMLWVKYESFEDGLIFDAAFDFGRLAELLDLTRFRLGTVFADLISRFSRE